MFAKLMMIATLAVLMPRQGFAQVPVDVALVLAVDASGSIDDAEFLLQKQGIGLAVTNQAVLGAIAGGPFQRIAISYVEWGGPGMVQTIVDWQIIEDANSADHFAETLLAAPRSPQSYNAIGDAIDHSVALLAVCPCEPLRRVIDISGDNHDSRSARPVWQARDAAVAQGITVNALAILDGRPIGLEEGYRQSVIGGPGAFVMPATTRADFARALRDKLILEIAGHTPAGWSIGTDIVQNLP